MNAQRDGGPAFPLPGWNTTQWPAGTPADFGTGMTLRDRIAIEALGGMLAHATRYRPYEKDRGLHWHEAISLESYEMADAMLAAREVRS